MDDPGYKGLAVLFVGLSAGFAIWAADSAMVAQREKDRPAQVAGFKDDQDMTRAKEAGFADSAAWRAEIKRRDDASAAERERLAAAETKRKAEEDERKKISNRRFNEGLLYAKALKKSMKNPDSFKLELVTRTADGIYCYEYRATNSFNAVVPGRAYIGAGKSGTSDGGAGFASQWNKLCARGTENMDLIVYALNNGY